jgi:ParB family chromosome partitioning protein
VLVAEPAAIYVDVERIAPAANNPRRNVGDVTRLADSIGAFGLLQPLVVRQTGIAYELVAGHRRLAAIHHLRMADPELHARWRQVPVIVITADDEQALLLAGQENLQRKDLSPRDQALYLELFIRKYGGVRKAAEILKLSHTYVGQRCRVFADDILAGPVMANQLDVSSAQELLRVADPVARAHLLGQAITSGWSKGRIRHEIDLLSAFVAPPDHPRIQRQLDAILRELERIGPDALTSDERESTVRLTRRLMTFLGDSLWNAGIPASDV